MLAWPAAAMSLTLCVLLWAHPGTEDALAAYEDAVLALVAEHGGRVVQRARSSGADEQPLEIQVLGTREAAFYPGAVANLWDANGFFYLDLAEPFVDEHLRLTAGLIRAAHRPQTSPLFNGHLQDAHFSAQGAALWGREVGRRLLRLSDFDRGRLR